MRERSAPRKADCRKGIFYQIIMREKRQVAQQTATHSGDTDNTGSTETHPIFAEKIRSIRDIRVRNLLGVFHSS